eukprot:TRINITY_DN17999_c0_g1_i1.p1 TRINITY_DN17999_c0_g1~~TRINITY_DN17999_c0_g1_i1.p1  ORF type:complete len:415 (+),score=55.37 TRINITY_DN17999_c0_g1_i1:35-1279(+)
MSAPEEPELYLSHTLTTVLLVTPLHKHNDKHEVLNYTIYCNGRPVECEKLGSQYAIENLTPGTDYRVVIEASNQHGSTRSKESTFRTAQRYGSYDETLAALTVVPGGEEDSVLHLDCVSMGFGGDGASRLCAAASAASAAHGPSLRSLWAIRCNIADIGAAAIATALHSTAIAVLDLRWNNISAAGAVALADALNSSPLTSLSIARNNIGDEGATALARAIADSEKLRCFEAYGCGIGPIGGAEIAKCLAVNNSLYSLKIENNKIGDAAARDIAKALRDHPTLTSISMHENDFSTEVADALFSTMGENPVLEFLTAVSQTAEERVQYEGALAQHHRAVPEYLSRCPAALCMTQDAVLGAQSPLFFLGVLLPTVADLLCPAFADSLAAYNAAETHDASAASPQRKEGEGAWCSIQ